jgi:BirA family biotin operon repressor/biotin-[acetyl-CoA-carboxylase] ligase
LTNLNAEFIGKVLLHFNEVTSTNAVALNLLSKSKPKEGTVISADFQTAGKGQVGTIWQGAKGQNVYLSLILYPQFLTATRQFLLSQAVALGVRAAISDFFPDRVEIKWPNDIYVNGQKLGGILIQNSLQGKSIQHSVIGIGLNINQMAFPADIGRPVSLRQLIHRETDLSRVQEALFRHLETTYLQLRLGKYAVLERDYLEHLYQWGKWAPFEEVASQEQFLARINGLSPQGKLQLQTEAGEQLEFGLKEVRFM